MLKATNPPMTRPFSGIKILYLILTIAGSIEPWFWLLQDSSALLSPSLFLQQAFANSIAAGLTADLLISAIAFFCFVWFELKRLDISRAWIILYIGLAFGVGLSCSLPFFLYRREQHLERTV
jgi:integral membrane sensor domain MASE1